MAAAIRVMAPIPSTIVMTIHGQLADVLDSIQFTDGARSRVVLQGDVSVPITRRRIAMGCWRVDLGILFTRPGLTVLRTPLKL